MHHDLAEARQRFLLRQNATEPLQSGEREDEVHKNADTKRDKQKNGQTTRFALGHSVCKLPENHRADKRFSLPDPRYIR